MSDTSLSKERKAIIREAAQVFGQFLTALRIDWQIDLQTQDTPMRVAKMYVNEILAGRFSSPPKMKFFACKKVQGMVTSSPIAFSALCPHHFIPFMGFVSISIVSSKKDDTSQLLGLSKYVQLVKWCSSRGYMQEELGRCY